ncbi:MAG: lytic transglycosylase domain-containing protein [Rhodobacteraceae bacterium]|nr:lytic transglycosylase domain-containing protein [Paracoccaceae bacterium]
MPVTIRIALALACATALAACGDRPRAEAVEVTRLYPGETVEMRLMIRQAAEDLDIPEALLHRVIQRESDYRADARNGPYWGLMQILPQTARTMGFRGEPRDLLDPEVNLRFAGRYLRGAWIVADHDMDRAVGYFARGYYYDARDRCLLVETGLAERETNRRCR